MGFDKKGDVINLLLFVTSGITNLLSILPKPVRKLMWLKPWFQSRSTKSVYHNIIPEPRLQDRDDYRKHFCMNSKTHFLISCLQFNLT